MTSAQQRAALAGANCEIAFDNLTRQLYASDASIHQVEPAAIAFPKNTRQASALVLAAAQAGISVTPRGAGTGLVGGALGDGLVIDFSRYNRQITELDLERRTVRVGPGVVLDQLNNFLRPHGYCFGPDVATSSQATLGGMIANNSSGAHTPAYGTTADHVQELEIVMFDGRIVMVGPGHDTLRKIRELVQDLIYFHCLEIEERFRADIVKRFPGYGISKCMQDPENLNHLLSGSEGTLAAITSAELRIVPLPREKALGLIFFASVAEAMQATVALQDLKPAAIEHVDRVLLDQTRGQREFQAARDLLELEHKPAQALLIVEFFDDTDAHLAELFRKRLGMRTRFVRTPSDMSLVWALRKAGLSLLTGCKGDPKPTTGIEDAAVAPSRLPDYVKAMEQIMGRLGLCASYYGHAAAGLLHVRPVLNLRSAEDRTKFRQLGNEVSALVRQFKGSLAAEHGVGIARTEFMPEQLGDGLMGVMRQIKTAFDPHNLFNPGKIVPDGRFRFDGDLRAGGDRAEAQKAQKGQTETGEIHQRAVKDFEWSVLAFAEKDGSFRANLDQCNGCGGCRKETPMMCPTFMVTGDEVLSTRGRANVIRWLAEGINGDWVSSPDLEKALSTCLSCKACVTECPSHLNLPLLKADLLHARIARNGLPWRERVLSSVDILGNIGCRAPWLANKALDSLLVRSLVTKVLGIAWQRPLPHYARQRFDRWFNKRAKRAKVEAAKRGRVVLWDDTFVRYHEPQIGVAAVRVLEAAGFEVMLPQGRKCCGRPAFSQGHLDRAQKLGRHNLALLHRDVDNAPILFLEPSCYSMFVQDYRELRLENTEAVASRCFLFEEFIASLLEYEPEALAFQPKPGRVILHAHCHLKSLMSPGFLKTLAERLPGREVTLLDSGCCGMAGGFGALESKYELSLKVAEPLMQKVRSQPFGTVVVASGTSCRQQIEHLAPVHAWHMAEVLAAALE